MRTWLEIRKFASQKFRLTQTAIDATEIHQCFYEMTCIKNMQTPATAENEKWHWIRVGRFKFLCPGPGLKETRRNLPESTPAIGISGHLWLLTNGWS